MLNNLFSQNQDMCIEEKLENTYIQNIRISHSTQKSPLNTWEHKFSDTFLCTFVLFTKILFILFCNLFHWISHFPFCRFISSSLWPYSTIDLKLSLQLVCPNQYIQFKIRLKILVMFLHSLLIQRSLLFNDLTCWRDLASYPAESPTF